MAEETWKIILQTDMSGAGGGSMGEETADGGVRQTAETPQQRKQLVEDAGKVFGSIAGVSGILAMVIKGIHDSVILSTAFNTIMKIISAAADLFLVAFWPIIMVVIDALLKFLPIAEAAGKALAPLIQKIAAGLSNFINTGNPSQLIDASVEFVITVAKEIGMWLASNSGNIVMGIQKAIVGFFTALGQMQPLFEAISQVFKKMEPVMTVFMDWLKENYIIPFMEWLVGATVQLFKNILEYSRKYDEARMKYDAENLGALFGTFGNQAKTDEYIKARTDAAEKAAFMSLGKDMPQPKWGNVTFPAEKMAQAAEGTLTVQKNILEETKKTNTLLEKNKAQPSVTININDQLNGPTAKSILDVYSGANQMRWK